MNSGISIVDKLFSCPVCMSELIRMRDNLFVLNAILNLK